MPTPLLIDTDTASDDAVALIMALRDPAFEVVAITVVAGNVALAQGSRNARYTVELCGASVPVYEGAAKPLARPPIDASFFHGQDGLGDQGYPPPKAAPAKGYGPSTCSSSTIRARPGLVLVTLGPLTNLALALQKAPGIASQVSRCVVMGGAACTVGNVTPAAEYNIWCDPEAARIVLPVGAARSRWWAGSSAAARRTSTTPTSPAAASIDTPLAHFTIDCNADGTRGESAAVPRPRHRPARPGRDGGGARSRDRDAHAAATRSRSSATARSRAA